MGKRDAELNKVFEEAWLRSADDESLVLRAGPFRVLPDRMRVEMGSRSVDLWPSEMMILTLLMEQQGRILTRRTILAHAGEDADEHDLQSVDMRISRLRKKLGRPGAWIRTVKGAGYTFCAPESPTPRRLLQWLAPLAALWAWMGRRPATAATIGGVVGVAATIGVYQFGSPQTLLTRTFSGSPVGQATRVTAPGPQIPSFGSFGRSVAYSDHGRLFTLVAPADLHLSPARLRSVDFDIHPQLGVRLQPLNTDRLRFGGRSIPAAETWGLGDAEAMRIGPGGTLLIPRADGRAIYEFDWTGRLLTQFDLSPEDASRLDEAGGVEGLAVNAAGQRLLAGRRALARAGGLIPAVLIDPDRGVSRALSYPLEDPQGELRDLDFVNDRWLLVAESAGPAKDTGTRLYLASVEDLLRLDRDPQAPIDKRLVLDTTHRRDDLGRFPLAGLAVGPHDPRDPAKRVLVLSAVAHIEPTHLWFVGVALDPLLPQRDPH